MYITNIRIDNFRGFGECDVKFHPRLNLFIGSNASGKTTLLTALIKSLYSITTNFAPSRFDVHQMLVVSDSDINNNSGFCLVRTDLAEFPGYIRNMVCAISKTRTGVPMNIDLRMEENSLREFQAWYSQKIKTSIQTVPIIKFYPANRGCNEYVEINDQSTYAIAQLETWSNLYQNSISYSKFFDWFFDFETNELRLQRDAQDFKIESKELKGVRGALAKTFEILGYGGVKVKTKQIKRFSTSKLTPTLVVENLNTNRTDEIDNKSDGEKAIIVLIADIAYNLSIGKDFTFDDQFLNSPGIVIIDEIESHLHPNWQRAIIPILTEVFPNIQFFIATHSPQVVSAVNSESIYICQDFKISNIDFKTKGEDTNTLLKYIFNSTERPKEYVDLIRKFHELMEARAEFQEVAFLIEQIEQIDDEDTATERGTLIEELKLQLEAYKFDREYDTNS